MRRRWFADRLTALRFPSYHYSTGLCVRAPVGLRLPAHSGGSTHVDVIIQRLNGLWHLIVGSCQIRTPFLETQDRALVVAYARRVYPGAKIIERD